MLLQGMLRNCAHSEFSHANETKKFGSGRNLILEKREPRDRGIPKFSKLSFQKFLPLPFVFLCGITQ